ncbi:MAG: (d)CMP kinase [Clostridiales bacterium]|jgi:cytidylate kinase|nr:(d)CMP kinase [Clostridiales bacterium]
MTLEKIKIAIDGPSGVGKSSVSKYIAKKFNLIYLETGIMYRAVAFYFLKNNLDYKSFLCIKKNIFRFNLEIKIVDNISKIFLDQEDISDSVKNSKTSQIASIIAENSIIRENLGNMQKKIARENNFIIIDGRDIASRIMPDANFKFYLDATPKIRAKRRFEENLSDNKSLEFLEKEIRFRDMRDKNRNIDPLKISKDSTIVNTDDINFVEVCKKICDIIKSSDK